MKILEKNICELTGYEKYTNYIIRNNGDIFNKKKGNKIAQTKCKTTGYYMVSLWSNNERRVCTVHRLLAIAFIENPNDYKEVNHKDGDKTNNSLYNLEWITHKENIKHAVNNGLHHPKFTKHADVRKRIICCDDGNVFESVKCAAEYYRTRNISSVLTGKRKTAGGYRFKYYE